MLHQHHLLALLGRHQPGVLVSAAGQRLLQLRLLLVQGGHVGVILLLGDPEKERRGLEVEVRELLHDRLEETILLILTTVTTSTLLPRHLTHQSSLHLILRTVEEFFKLRPSRIRVGSGMLSILSVGTLVQTDANFLFRSLNFSVVSSLSEPLGPFLSPSLCHHRLFSIPPSGNFSVWSPVSTQSTSDQVFLI